MQKYQHFLAAVNEQYDLEKTIQLLTWDREVNMPPGGNQERSFQLATLNQILHSRIVSDQFGQLIEDASAEIGDLHPDSTEARLISVVKRKFKQQSSLTADFVNRRAMAEGGAIATWKQAREELDFSIFEPHLAIVIELSQEMAEMLGYEDEMYDALLDQYEYGMKTAEVRQLFDVQTKATRPLLDAIIEKDRFVDDSFLHRAFPIDKQQAYARELLRKIGYDFARGQMSSGLHPFAVNFGSGDSRIVGGWRVVDLKSGIFATLHESGHAIYEQNISPEFTRTPLAIGASLGIHESQSRAIENVIGRSYGFWHKEYPQLQASFPSQLNAIKLDQFYRAINIVKPSFTRIHADEVTYNFHIILRFEMELAMLAGEIKAKDVPTVWNDKMQSLLGITPPNDYLGCLQDIHWVRPSFGYFPTYTLGNLYNAQFYEAMVEQDPTIQTELDHGNTDKFVEWMRSNIQQYGAKYTPREMSIMASGKPICHEPYVRYLTKKFTKIYDL